MKPRVSLISFSLLIVMVLGFFPGNGQAVLALTSTERHVCSSGCTYSSIQAAVDVASDGDVIKIAAGTYSGVSTEQYYNLSLTQSIFINNKSLTLEGGYTPSNWTTSNPVANVTTVDAQGKGRVLFIDLRSKSATISGLHLINGDSTKSGDLYSPYAGFTGGGVDALGHGTTPSSTITFTNDTISDNTSNGEGAGLYVWAITATLTGNTISNNQIINANGKYVAGGGLDLVTTTAQVTNNQFIDNSVPFDDYYGDEGGGLFTRYSTVTLTGNTFKGNQAPSGGGLSELRASMVVSGNQFISNVASNGGGLYFGSDTDASITLDLTGNTFTGNTVSESGGGAWLTPYQVSAKNNTFDSNTTTGVSDCGGAGLFVAGSNKVVVDHNTITNNTAVEVGGGVCVETLAVVENNLISGNKAPSGGGVAVLGQGADPSSYNPLLVNNVINGNQVTGDGSAVFIEASSLTLTQATISHNAGGDAGILLATNLFSKCGTLTLTNAILDHQTTGINATHCSTATVNGVLWSTVTTPFKSTDAGGVTVQNQVTGEVKFAADGYHILAGSDAIDHGVASGITTDIDGQTRPYGAGYDLGADEWAPLLYIFLPLVIK